MQVSCKNKSDKAMPTTQALHTYFCVTDITKVSITGLESSAYLDNLAARAEQAATQAPITISQEVDRIYMKTGAASIIPGSWKVNLASTVIESSSKRLFYASNRTL